MDVRSIAGESRDNVDMFVREWPSGLRLVLRRFRTWLKLRLVYRVRSVGRDFWVGSGTHIRSDSLTAGDYCFIGRSCHIASQVEMGNWVMVASCVSMVGGDHVFRKEGVPSIFAGALANRPIIIGDDAWIGHGAIIMHGVRIGRGAVVAAGALVTRDVPDYAIVASRPAEPIGQRF